MRLEEKKNINKQIKKNNRTQIRELLKITVQKMKKCCVCVCAVYGSWLLYAFIYAGSFFFK